MSQPKRRSRKSKLVPRSVEGGEPEIQEIIESEDDNEPPIKITKTVSLAAPQPGPSKPTGSIQFKVDIEVEEWIDDELFIEENFNKMQTEKLSKALDKEITEEADWTNEEYGKFWAEAASDSDHDEQPLNEYEKIIKNQIDLSVLAGPSKDKSESSKYSVNIRPGTLKENGTRTSPAKGTKKDNKLVEGTNVSSKGNKESKTVESYKDLSKGIRKGNKTDESKKDISTENKTDESNKHLIVEIKKENNPDESENDSSKVLLNAPPKNNETKLASPVIPPLRPIRQYKRPGLKENNPDESKNDSSKFILNAPPKKDDTSPPPTPHKIDETKLASLAIPPLKPIRQYKRPGLKENNPDESKNDSSKFILNAPPKKDDTSPPPTPHKNNETKLASPAIPPLKPIRQYKRPGPKSKTCDISSSENTSSLTSTGKSLIPAKDLSTDEKPSSVYEKTFKWPKSTETEEEPKIKISILCSDEGPTTYHIDLSDPANVNLASTKSENQKKTWPKQKLAGPTKTQRMTITELDKFAKTYTGVPKAESEVSAMVELSQMIALDASILSDSKLLSATSVDPTDHILDIEVRNRIGNSSFVPIEISREDALIDYALRQWIKWLGGNKVKSTPLTYKCYICNVGWWHLHKFRIHIKKHPRVIVKLEVQNQECNIIAHNGKSNSISFPIQDKCWKCGNDYLHHLKVNYQCKGCQSLLFTCKALAEHEGICLNLWKKQMEAQTTKDIKAYKCKICPQIFFTEELLHNHQYYSHVPRSDHPMAVQVNQCNYCNQNYVFYAFHYCSGRVQKFKCMYCSRHYPSYKALKTHVSMVKNNVPCIVCKEVVVKECMMPRHLLAHNKNYVMAYKCLTCMGKNLYLEDVTMVTRHAEYVHKVNKYVKGQWCYAQVPLPRLSFRTATTKHTPTPMHDKLKEAFVKDMLLFRDDVRKINTDGNESQDSSEDGDLQINDHQIVLEQPSDCSSTIPGSQDSSEVQEAPEIKIENVMENYFEEENTETEFPTIDTSSIKIEVEENVDGTEVNPADLLNMTVTEDLVVVKKEEPDDDSDIDESQDSSMDTSIISSNADTKNLNKEFSEKVLKHLSNRDENEEEEIKDNINICLNCDFEGKEKEFKKHLRVCNTGEIAKKNQEAKCTKCDKDFRNLKEYVRHLPKHGFTWCRCTECNRVFTCLYNWMNHIKMHIRRTFTSVYVMSSDSKVFRCRYCKEFVERKMFFNHWEMHLGLPKEIKQIPSTADVKVEGTIAPEVLSKIEEIFGMSKTAEIPNHCIICSKLFNRLSEKKRHLVEHLLEAAAEQMLACGGLRCQFCGLSLLKPDGFRQHMRDHANLTMYHCEFCNKTFSDSSNFVKHKKVHDVVNFVCDVCNKKFMSKATLEAHIANHRPEPLHCALCPTKLFYSESAYNRHVRMQHDRSSNFKCPYCRERFPSLKRKWEHLWEQHKVRSQIADCPMCDKKFRRYLDLKSHVYKDHLMKGSEHGVNVLSS